VYNFSRDWNGGPLERLVAANIRVPDQTIGDFYAQFASNAIGAERVKQLCEKYGTDSVARSMTELIDYSERRFRAALREVPDGEYFGEDAIDDDGLSDEPLVVKAKVTVQGDSVHVDFDGTCPQVRRNLNCPWASTISATLAAIKATLTSADIPFNEGMKSAVTVTAPAGCLVNPIYPAPVRARMLSAYRCFDAVLKALAQAVPDKVIAGGNDSTHSTAISHLSGSRYKVYLEIFGGGYGASPRVDGCDAVDSTLSNCTNVPIEAMDMDFDHFRVEAYTLVPDSCGHGRQRGGLALMRRYRILKDNTNFARYSDRARIAPFGLFGGTDGGRSYCELTRDGQTELMPSKGQFDLKKGDILSLYTAGGGGYGAVDERSGNAIAQDIREGYVTREAALAIYGRTE
jgi:N-methylhydantoinase B